MGRTSTVEKLPEDILEKLQSLLRDPRVNQLDATAKINAILGEQGHDTVSKSAVNRYAQKMAQVGKRLQESRDMAQMWIGKLGSAPQGEVGKLLNETIRTLAFETTMKMAEDENEAVSPKVLAQLSLAVQRLEASATLNLKRDEEIRKQAREEAAEDMEKIAKEGGISAETVLDIKRKLLNLPV